MFATTSSGTEATAQDATIQPFHAAFPDEALDDLRRHIAATRWSPKELVDD